jgi:cobalt-precorrin 5A hydrolase
MGGTQTGGKVMMAIGIGARSGVTADDISDAIAQAAREAGQSPNAVATLDEAKFLDSVRDAAARAKIQLTLLTLADLQSRSAECQTTSERALSLFDVTSIAEAAALAAAGPGSKLVVQRLICGQVTAAAAISNDHVKDTA